jgi:hypothetical protein
MQTLTGTFRPHTAAIAAAIAAAVGLAGCAVDVDVDAASEVEVDAVVNPSGDEQALTMPSCGTVLASFDGTDAKSNARNTGTGVACAGQGGIAGGLQYQCVELVMRHFKRKWNLRWYGNAKDLLRNAPRADVVVVSNGDRTRPPVPGDMVVWENGTWGHTALVVNVGADFVDIIEQNVNGNGKARLPYENGRIGSRWGGWVPTGWAHAKANTASSPPPPPASSEPTTCRVQTVGAVVDEDEDCVDLGGNANWLRAVSGQGHGGSVVWTHATADADADNSATWRLNVARAGDYRVDVFVDADVATSRQASYRVRHNGVVDTVVVDQRQGGWRTLGKFAFATGGSQRVYLGDNTGEPVGQQRKIAFDAVRLTPACANLEVATDGGATLNVRAQPSASAERLGQLNSGAVVERLATVEGQQIQHTSAWHEVRGAGLRGFVSAAFMACPR